MARIKIDYGIDLGTTNSAICRMENGEPKIFKCQSLKDTLPSCVSITKRVTKKDGSIIPPRIKVGDTAFNDLKSEKDKGLRDGAAVESNAFIEFKRTMGTNAKYYSSNMEKEFSSEELSAEVLKTLKSYVLDDDVKSIVVTVPAKFTVNQKTATIEAAKMAGFEHCVLLQEPIAAAMAYGLSSKEKNGNLLVFDFGGGTFDAALLKVEEGIIEVMDTEGDNYLGGKDLDYAIVDKILIPNIAANHNIDDILSNESRKKTLREVLKIKYAENIKNQLSFNESEDVISDLGELGFDDDGEEIELSKTVTRSEMNEVIEPIFQKAVDICLNLLKKNNLSGNDLNKLILVGGPTHSPIIRQMLKEQINQNVVDTSVDPMTVVATGAALFASTIDNESSASEVVTDALKLKVGYKSTSVQDIEFVTIQLEGDIAKDNDIFVEIVSADNTWLSGKNKIDVNGNVVEVPLKEGRANAFKINLYDENGTFLKCTPNEFTIIQGTQIGSTVLPYDISFAVWDERKNKKVVRAFEGLERNKPLPAVGVNNKQKTSCAIRPGVSSDLLTIPIYQSDEGRNGGSAYLCEYVCDVVITGAEVETLIPVNSTVELTLKVDTSEQMSMEVFFPDVDISIVKELDTSKKHDIKDAGKEARNCIEDAQRVINTLAKKDIDVSDLQSDLDVVKDEQKNCTEEKALLKHARDVMQKIETRESETEFDRIEKELKDMFRELEQDQKKYGTYETGQIVNEFRSQVDDVIAKKDVNSAKEVLRQVRQLDMQLALVEYFIAWIYDWNKRFDVLSWKDKSRARQLINEAIGIINDNPTADNLRPLVDQLINLLPRTQQPKDSGGLLH